MHHETVLLNLIMPSEMLASIEVDMITLPGCEGVFGVLPNHAPLVANLKSGIITATRFDQDRKFFVNGGIVRVTSGVVDVITEFAVDMDNITKADAISRMDQVSATIEQLSKDDLRIAPLSLKLKRYGEMINYL